MQRPACRRRSKDAVYTRGRDRGARGLRRLAGPGPGHPRATSSTTPRGRRRGPVRGGEFFRTNCTACHNFSATGGALPQVATLPHCTASTPSTCTRRCSPDRSRCRVLRRHRPQPRRTSGTSSPTSSRSRTSPTYGGSALGSLGPVTEGLWGWLVGIGSLVLVAVWIGNNGVREESLGRSEMSDDLAQTGPGRTPGGLPGHRALRRAAGRAHPRPWPARARAAAHRRRREPGATCRAPGRRAVRRWRHPGGAALRRLLHCRQQPDVLGHRRSERRHRRRTRLRPARSSVSAPSSGPRSS